MSLVVPEPASADLASRNLAAALALLRALQAAGLGALVVCPGSRSAPLAAAAGLLAAAGALPLFTAIDERSAAFFALGWGRASGRPAAVITTSGTAVANLLPAAVEADYGTIPLLLLTADRPAHLKGCGANQTVNQEAFLQPSLRWFGAGDGAGVAAMAAAALAELARAALAHCLGPPPGPVQLNLPFAEPLHASAAALRGQASQLAMVPAPQPGGAPALAATGVAALGPQAAAAGPAPLGLGGLDPDKPGLVVAGPWRGAPQAWPDHLAALRRWQRRTGWPVLADGLSGLRGSCCLTDGGGLALVAAYDLVGTRLPAPMAADLADLQVLRLGPLPASRRLQQLLLACGGPQLLVSEGDPRPLDPLGRCRQQWPAGLAAWLQQLPSAVFAAASGSSTSPAAASLALAARWRALEQRLQDWLDGQLLGDGAAWGEPAIARRLARLLPPGRPLVIANSSPVRDWESFTPGDGPERLIHACRGASGIDGTLSMACGVAASGVAAGGVAASGSSGAGAVLLSGDLALLHDSNGWLWQAQLPAPLLVVLIDNGGGGIFEQLPIRPREPGPDPQPAPLDFERLFAMPQAVDQAALAAAHGVPSRQVNSWAALEAGLAWGLEQPLALLVLRTDRQADAAWRQALRRMACSLVDSP